MKFGEIYSNNFLDFFDDDKREQIKDIDFLNEKPYIDIDKVFEVLDAKKEFKPMNDTEDGEYSKEDDIIYINDNKPPTRKRFTEAHELGHRILHHQGKSLRTEIMTEYDDVIKQSNEMSANKFAAELLMPRKLMVRLVKQISADNNINDNALTSEDIELLKKELSSELGVSEESLGYRISNVRLFTKK